MTIVPLEGLTASVASITAAAGVATTSPVAPLSRAQGANFAQMLLGGIDKVNHDVQAADAAARAFALDDSIPLHQVTFALEQARLSVELMMQVRSRLLEGYQELLRMQI